MNRSLEHARKPGKEPLTQKKLAQLEKERRDVIFRDKNAANFNITGEKSFKKKYPVKKVKKAYYNDILSCETYLADLTSEIEHKSFYVPPIDRKLSDVLATAESLKRNKV